jgi:hypothetical protein
LREKNELSRGFESKKLTSESQQFEEMTVLVRIFDVTNKDQREICEKRILESV